MFASGPLKCPSPSQASSFALPWIPRWYLSQFLKELWPREALGSSPSHFCRSKVGSHLCPRLLHAQKLASKTCCQLLWSWRRLRWSLCLGRPTGIRRQRCSPTSGCSSELRTRMPQSLQLRASGAKGVFTDLSCSWSLILVRIEILVISSSSFIDALIITG